MIWQVKYSRTFYKELARMPASVRTRIEAVVFGSEIKNDPFLSGKVEKLSGYDDYYKIRFGTYRVGLRLDKEDKIVEFRRVLHRKDIYRKFP